MRINSEVFCVFESSAHEIYYNRIVNFFGTLAEAEMYAKEYNYGGGVKIIGRTAEYRNAGEGRGK